MARYTHAQMMARGTWRGMAAGLRFLPPLACAQALIPGHREQTFGTLCFLQDLLPKLADKALPTDLPNNMNIGSYRVQKGKKEQITSGSPLQTESPPVDPQGAAPGQP